MENASKALIIAGAILLAILLISLGIMIFTQAQDTVSGSGMTEAEVTAFNQKFTKYEGTVKGSIVKSLIQEVNANNSNDANTEKIVKLVSASGSDTELSKSTDGSYTTSSFVSTNTYKITVEDYKDGRVSKISIVAVK